MGRGLSNRRFAIWLALIVVAAAALRVVFVVVFVPRTLVFNDSVLYHLEANYLADGRGFVNAAKLLTFGQRVPTAEHPPLFPLVLSVVSRLGGRTVLAHRLTTCAIGATTVAIIGLAGRRVAGPRAGLLAAGLAAIYPNLWIIDSQVMSESLYALTIAVFILAAYRYWDAPSTAGVAVLGATVGVAALVRAEALALLAIVVLPLTWWAGQGDEGRTRAWWARGAIAILAAGAVVSPWVVRNLVTFDHPILFTSNSDTVLAGAYCDSAYHGPDVGSWSFVCILRQPQVRGDESDEDVVLRTSAWHYFRANTGRLPVVVAAREGRTWSLFQPLRQGDGRTRRQALLSVVSFTAGMALALAGAVVLRRRRRPLSPLLGQAVLVVLVTGVTYGVVRFRVPWEVALLILAGAGLDALFHRSRRPDLGRLDPAGAV